MYMYGTIRSDRGEQYTTIKDTKLENYGDFNTQYSNYPMPMTIQKWRDSIKKGSYFIITCHDNTETTVICRERGYYMNKSKNIFFCAPVF